MGGESTEQERSFNAVWDNLSLFSATVATGTTTTGAVINVLKSSSQTIYVDLTGTDVTGAVLTVRGEVSGIPAITLRAFTATVGTQAWKIGSTGFHTGTTAGLSGVSRFQNIFLQVQNPASVTGGSTVTVKARAVLSPEF